MVEEVESLVLEASVLDDFSRTLDELSSELTQIAAQEEQVDPIEIDAHVASALAELEVLEQRLRALDTKDVDVDVGIDRDRFNEEALAAHQFVERQIQTDDDIPTFPGRRQVVEGRQRSMRARIPRLRQPEVDVIPDLDMLRRREFDRGPLQNLRDAIEEFGDMRLTMGLLMNVLAALVPLLVVFVGALPAAISGVVALGAAALIAAGALGALGALGLGAMAFEDGQLNVAELQRHARSIFDTFLEAFMPLMEALKPAIEDAFRIGEMFIRDMATAMRGLLDLTDEFSGGLQWIADAIVAATGAAIQFTEAAAPVIGFIAGGLADIDWFGIFAGIIEETLPLLTQFAGIILMMAGPIFRISMQFFRMTNAVFAVLGGVIALLDAVPFLLEGLASLASLILVAISVSALWTLTQTQTAKAVGLLAARVYTATFNAIYPYISAQLGAAAATWATRAAVIALMAALSFGLAPLITGVVGQMAGFRTQVGGAADEMSRLRNESNRFNPSGFSAGSYEGTPGYSQPSGGGMTVVAPDKETGNAAANSIRFSNKTGATTDQSDVDNRHHSGGG